MKGRKCRTCRTLSSATWHGEKGFFGWRYWCGECARKRFIGQVLSSPQATAKYVQIYGRMPAKEET